ncbi:MAG: AMP-binding protein [Verrucomicrobia bacterium]|nr:AMP-binding protein [Verrucomicrobiota bacterium]
MTPPSANIVQHLDRAAEARPQAAALKVPRGRTRSGDIDYLTLSFAELRAEVAAWRARLEAAGTAPGDRTLVMVPPGLPLIAAVFALFHLGAVPVVIDPGMGRAAFLSCVARSQPRRLVGIPLTLLLSHLFRGSFRSVGSRILAGGSLMARLTRPGPAPVASLPAWPARPEDLAAILFTSGSTGAPKGVCYEHGIFAAQVDLIRQAYNITPGEIDLPLLPIFALFNPALGMTTVVPELDPRRPAALAPERIVQAIQQEQVTNSFGSPTLWRRIARHCDEHQVTLPSLRRVLCAGAAVPADLWAAAPRILPRGRLQSPYGATEALPLTSITQEEVAALATPPAGGACVGRPLPGITVRVIAAAEGPLAADAVERPLPPGEIGEIIAAGPVVTKAYDAAPDATLRAKIIVGDRTWHRLGDCGYLDAEGRLWFCGRQAERVETATGTLFPEPCEQVFRRHPAVARCALVGLGERPRQRPALVVEASLQPAARESFAAELRSLAGAHAVTREIRTFLFHPRFPVDVRHNAKIHRLALARWAATARSYPAAEAAD